MDISTIRQNYSFFSKGIYQTYLSIYKQFLMNADDRAEDLKLFEEKNNWRSNIVIGVIQKGVSAMFTSIYDNKIYFNVTPTMWYWLEDDETADKQLKGNRIKQTLEYIFDKSGAKTQLFDATQDAILLGNGYTKTNYIDKSSTVNYISDWIKKKITIDKKEMPSIDYVSPFRFFFDPVASSLEVARYMGERYFVWTAVFVESFYVYLKVKYKNKSKANIIKELENLIGSNSDRIDSVDYELEKKQLSINTHLYSYRDVDVRLANWTKTYEVIEVYEKTINWYQLCLYIEGNKVYEWPSIYPLDEPPYQTITYKKIPWNILGQGIWQIVYDIQLLINALWNMHIDSSIITSIPAFVEKTWPADDFNSWDKTIDLAPWKVFKVDIDWGLEPLKIEKITTLMDNIQWLMQEMNSEIGINDITLGTQGKVERSAAGVNAQLTQSKARLRPLSQSMSEAMANVGKMWLALLINKQGWKITKSPLRLWDTTVTIEDLSEMYNIEFAIEWLHSSTKEAMRKQITDATPTLLNIRDNITGLPVIDWFELGKLITRTFEMPTDIVKTNEQLMEEKGKIDEIQLKQQIELERIKREEAKKQLPQTPPQTPSQTSPQTPQWWGNEMLAKVMEQAGVVSETEWESNILSWLANM